MNLFYSLFITALIFTGCGIAEYHVAVANSSALEVSYNYNGVSDTLGADEAKNYTVKAYAQPPSNISCGENQPLKVYLDAQNDLYTFKDAPQFDLAVKNYCSFDVTLTAGNYIDFAGSISLLIEGKNAGDEYAEESAAIYTKKPRFTADPADKVTISYKIENNTVNVTIRGKQE